MDTVLKKVEPDHMHILKNLFEYYVYEFSAYIPTIAFQANGTFGYESFAKFFTEPGFFPYFIFADGKMAGFVVVQQANETGEHPCFLIKEFFVAKQFNGRGVGKKAAFLAFDLYKGNWIVTQIKPNLPAQAFWRKVIASYTNQNFTETIDEHNRIVQHFCNEKRV
ncbi:MAG: GNAT family N-acetyltransferase [Clostridia bacterium]